MQGYSKQISKSFWKIQDDPQVQSKPNIYIYERNAYKLQ